MHVTEVVRILIGASLAIYVLSGLLFVLKQRIPGLVALGLAWVVSLVVVAVNWIVGGHPPLGNMYHVLVFLGLCFPPIYAFVAWRTGFTWLDKYFAFSAAVPLIGSMFMEADVLWQRMPALQSPWFVPHVVSYMISYSLAAVAFALVLLGAVRGWWLSPGSDIEREEFEEPVGTEEADGPVLLPYKEAAYGILLMAFPFMTFGMFSGAIWADQAWGGYWSWDPKETWSLITWTLYLVYFHCRLRARLRKYATPAHVLAFAALVTTFVLVNLLPKLASALHSYT